MFKDIDTQILQSKDVDARRERIVSYFEALGIDIRALDQGKNHFKTPTLMGKVSQHINQWMQPNGTNALDTASNIIQVIKCAVPAHPCWKDEAKLKHDLQPLIIQAVIS